MAEIVDIGLVADAERILMRLLKDRGIAFFMAREGERPMALAPEKIDLVVKSASRARARKAAEPSPLAVELCRRRIRRELIRRVALALVGSGC